MSYQDHVYKANVSGVNSFKYMNSAGELNTYRRMGDSGVFFNATANGLVGGARGKKKRAAPKRKCKFGKLKQKVGGRQCKKKPKKAKKAKKAKRKGSRSPRRRRRNE